MEKIPTKKPYFMNRNIVLFLNSQQIGSAELQEPTLKLGSDTKRLKRELKVGFIC